MRDRGALEREAMLQALHGVAEEDYRRCSVSVETLRVDGHLPGEPDHRLEVRTR